MALIAAYAFTEGTGTTAAEVDGGTAITDIPSWAAGLHGNAAFINLNGSFSLDPFTSDGPYTIMYDLYKVGPGQITYNMLVFGDFGTLQEFNGGLEFYPSIGMVADQVSTGSWVHVAVSGDGTNTRMFVNGTLIGTSGLVTTTSGTDPFLIGSQTGGSYTSNIRVDNLRVFNHAMTTGAEVAEYAGVAVTSAVPSTSEGSASGSWSITGTATGTTTREGAGTGTHTWSGSATGTTTRVGAASGAHTWTGIAAGTGGSADLRDIAFTVVARRGSSSAEARRSSWTARGHT